VNIRPALISIKTLAIQIWVVWAAAAAATRILVMLKAAWPAV